ncbi:DUF4865 family protein [Catenulispora pinisilvae]|uniref:DUF4865 family protein n=1 Tax=Catenulispora pinisilvae TaxID=2705253 RepID=UPI001891E4E5|nr:DUF4865 family protein [Catenulispora pinisilvae]
MYAMQYEISLPADYDMGILRERVEKAKPLLDDREGVGFKAYAIREAAKGSPVNQYAPFYFWSDTGAMSSFLFADNGFERIIRSFGRVPVRQWTGVAHYAGPARAAEALPRAASRRTRPVPVFDDTLGAWLAETAAEAERTARRDGAHTVGLAIDPTRWELVEFALWADAVPGDVEATERYEVLHVSKPSIGDLPVGLVR